MTKQTDMQYFDQYMEHRALVFKFGASNSDVITDLILDDPETAEKLKVKNVCAKISCELSDELDYTCNILGLSKRKFVEMAISAAIERCGTIMEKLDIFEPHTTASKPRSGLEYRITGIVEQDGEKFATIEERAVYEVTAENFDGDLSKIKGDDILVRKENGRFSLSPTAEVVQ